MQPRLFIAFIALASGVCLGASTRQSIPTADQIKTATAKIRVRFQKDYKDPSAADILAQTLLDHLTETGVLAEQYACCTDAYDMATKAGQTSLALQAVEAMDLRFANVNALEMKVAALAQLASKPPAPDHCAELLQPTLEAYLDALPREGSTDHQAVEKLVPLLRMLAAKAKPSASGPLDELLKEGGNLTGRRRGLGIAAMQRVKQTPSDAKANDAAGRWLCFGARNWEQGLEYLSHSDNPDLKRMALLELRAADPNAVIEVAKQWVLLPEKIQLDALSAANARSHARQLCEQLALTALPAMRDQALALRDHTGDLAGVSIPAAHLRVAKVHHARIIRLMFTPDSSTLFSASRDGMVATWNVASASAVASGIPNGPLTTVSFVPLQDGGHVAINTFRRCGVYSNADLKTELMGAHDFEGLAGAKDGRLLYGSDGLSVTALAMEAHKGNATKKALHNWTGHVTSLLLTPDQKLMVAGFDDCGVRCYTMEKSSDAPLWTVESSSAPTKIRVTPDGKTLWICWDRVGGIRQVDLRTGTVLASFDPLESAERNLPECSPNDSWFLGWNQKEKKVELWNTATKKAVSQFGSANVAWACWLPDSKRFLVAEGLTLHLRDVNKTSELATFDTGTTSIAQVAASPDGKWAVTGSTEGDVRFWPMPLIKAQK